MRDDELGAAEAMYDPNIVGRRTATDSERTVPHASSNTSRSVSTRPFRMPGSTCLQMSPESRSCSSSN